MKKINLYFLFSAIVVFMSIALILGIPDFESNWGTTNHLIEDSGYSYNFSSNITDTENGTHTYSILGVNSTLYPSQQNISFYTWFSINSTSGIMNINSTMDNQTGRFNVSVQVLNQDYLGESRPFYFIINATNDYPNFTHVHSSYNFTQDSSFIDYINASDEEKHYPLSFNLTYINCTHATWWNGSGDCNLTIPQNVSNTSIILNYTPLRNDVGVYYANLTVRDFGKNYTCSSGYCTSDYSENKTTIYSEIITFNVFSTLEINSTDCQNRTFQENQVSSCIINITTKGINDSLNISSRASVRNYQASVSNISWFYGTNLFVSENYTKSINVSFTPTKTEIGNWTINFSANDLDFNQNVMEPIYVYINRTTNDVPEIEDISNVNTSIDLLTRINITVFDDDLLIPDKLQGYNETINFSVKILRQTNLSQELNITNFYVQIISMPVLGTNKTLAKIEFTPNVSEALNYTINITATDKENNKVSELFNLSIINNNAPQFIMPLTTNIVLWENNISYLNLTQNVSDDLNSSMTFSYTIDNDFKSFYLNPSTGVINITLNDSDVGQHLVTITVSDGYLTNSTIFNFTIYNINDNPYIEKPFQSSNVINATLYSNYYINASEDNLTTIYLWVQDDDFRILSNQRSFYNESINLSLSIQGPNTNLFNFTLDSSYAPNPLYIGNKSKYIASFTPNNSDRGSYNITVNITDKSNVSDIIILNLTVLFVEHNPILSNVTNHTTAINRSFYYRINASDSEDGNSTVSGGNNNLTFSYSFLTGNDFINNNQSIFNTTTGEINITFNSTNGGTYRLNITINDSSGRQDSDNFYIYVYDIPSIIYPDNTTTFSFVENLTYNLTFISNHSVLDNLTYNFYIEDFNGSDNLRYSLNYFGNNTNLTWNFSPNLSDESLGIRNLTLIVYPTNSLLANNSDLNLTIKWNISITHTNSLLETSNVIGGVYRNLSGGSPYQLTLSNYFDDEDSIDIHHNQTIGFVVNLINATTGTITYNVTNWTNANTPMIYFSSTGTSRANYTITAYEYNESNLSQVISNITSNIFSIDIVSETVTIVVPTPSPGGGGGGGGTVSGDKSRLPFAFKIVSPGKVSAFSFETIKIPISLVNNGKNEFSDIDVVVSAYKDGSLSNLVKTTLDKSHFDKLSPNKTENIALTVYFGTDKTGDYEILINATSKNPLYSDWGKIYVNVQKTNETEIKKYLLFTEEFLVQNPNCLELTEMLDEANKLFEEGKIGDARVRAEAIVNQCKEYIAQTSLPEFKLPNKFSINEIILISSIVAFCLGITYYYIKRRKIRGYEYNTDQKI
jgi:hypothetical protein